MRAERQAKQQPSRLIRWTRWLAGVTVLVCAVAAAVALHREMRPFASEQAAHQLAEPAKVLSVGRSRLDPLGAESATAEAPGSRVVPLTTKIELTRALQMGLRRAHCYDGPINGVWSGRSRDAMDRFVELLNVRLPVEQPERLMLALIEANPNQRCTPRDQAAPMPDAKGPGSTVPHVLPSSVRGEPKSVTALVPYARPELRRPGPVEGAPHLAAATGAGAVAAASLASVPTVSEAPRLAPQITRASPVASERVRPARASQRARATRVYPQRYRYVSRRAKRGTLLGSFSNSVSRGFSSLQRAFSSKGNR